jgi:hypothetical protein
MSEQNEQITIPCDNTLNQAAKLSIKISKPVCFYFYLDSCRGNINIGTTESDKIIFKNMEEHTSTISNIYKVNNEFLVVTENTIYIISAGTKVTKLPEDFSQ